MNIISLDTAVFCENNQCGIVYQLIIQPPQFNLTHLAVKPANQSDRLISVTHITEISGDAIYLKGSMAQFNRLTTFTETSLIEVPEADYSFEEYGSWYQGISRQTKMYVPVSHYKMPPGGLVINRQTQIEAKNGHVGQFKELVINPDTYQITHLVFQRGHLWERKREVISASLIDRMEGDTIYLNINKADL